MWRAASCRTFLPLRKYRLIVAHKQPWQVLAQRVLSIIYTTPVFVALATTWKLVQNRFVADEVW